VAVSDAVQSGAFPPVDEEATAETMLGYLEGIQLLAKARNDPELIRRLGLPFTHIFFGPGDTQIRHGYSCPMSRRKSARHYRGGKA